MSDTEMKNIEIPSPLPQSESARPNTRSTTASNFSQASAPGADNSASQPALKTFNLPMHTKNHRITKTYSATLNHKLAKSGTDGGRNLERILAQQRAQVCCQKAKEASEKKQHQQEALAIKNACKTALKEVFLTEKGMNEFLELLQESPKIAKKYNTMKTKIRWMDEWNAAAAEIKRRCWVRLRMEERMCDEHDNFDCEVVDAFFKDERKGMARNAQYLANMEPFLTEDGITVLWVMFEYEEAWADQYTRKRGNTGGQTEALGFFEISALRYRAEFLRDLFKPFLLDEDSPYPGDETVDDMFTDEANKDYYIIQKAVSLPRSEKFLTEEGVKALCELLEDSDSEVAIEYIELAKSSLGLGDARANTYNAKRAIWVMGRLKTCLCEDDDGDAATALRWKYFTDEYNAPYAHEKALGLVQEEKGFFTDEGFGMFTGMLFCRQSLITEYVKVVEVEKKSAKQRALWIRNTFDTFMDDAGSQFDLESVDSFFTGEANELISVGEAQIMAEDETFLTEEGLAMVKEMFEQFPVAATEYMDRKKTGSTEKWMWKNLQNYLTYPDHGGIDYEEVFSCFTEACVVALAMQEGPKLAEREDFLSDKGKEWFMGVLQQNPKIARIYLKVLLEKKKDKEYRYWWVIDVFKKCWAHNPGENFEEAVGTCLAEQANTTIYVSKAKLMVEKETFLIEAGIREFAEMVEACPELANEYLDLKKKVSAYNNLAKGKETKAWMMKMLGEYNGDENGDFDEKVIDERFFKEEFTIENSRMLPKLEKEGKIKKEPRD